MADWSRWKCGKTLGILCLNSDWFSNFSFSSSYSPYTYSLYINPLGVNKATERSGMCNLRPIEIFPGATSEIANNWCDGGTASLRQRHTNIEFAFLLRKIKLQMGFGYILHKFLTFCSKYNQTLMLARFPLSYFRMWSQSGSHYLARRRCRPLLK